MDENSPVPKSPNPISPTAATQPGLNKILTVGKHLLFFWVLPISAIIVGNSLENYSKQDTITNNIVLIVGYLILYAAVMIYIRAKQPVAKGGIKEMISVSGQSPEYKLVNKIQVIWLLLNLTSPGIIGAYLLHLSWVDLCTDNNFKVSIPIFLYVGIAIVFLIIASVICIKGMVHKENGSIRALLITLILAGMTGVGAYSILLLFGLGCVLG